jgi:very-short-patch-repair endonuclease
MAIARGTGTSIDDRVAAFAAVQHGVVARAQLAELGVTKDMIRHRCLSGRWERLDTHALRIAGAPPTWRQSLLAGCFAWGPGAVVSYRAAACLFQLPGIGPLAEFTVPRRCKRSGPGRVHRSDLPAVDLTVVDAIPVTTPTRTFVDVAAFVGPEQLEEMLDDALRRGLTSLPRLRWRLDETGGRRRGTGTLRRLIESRAGAPVPRSVFETRLLRLMRRANLPQPIRQHAVRDGGGVVAVVDFAYPEARLAIEADGYGWHSTGSRWHHDRLRSNALMLLGWRIVHVTWRDMTGRPDHVIASIRAALAST